MRLLLTGASGYFGQHFAPPTSVSFELISAYFSQPEKITAGTPVELDLKDPAQTQRKLRQIQPEIIVHTAGSNRDPQTQASIVPGPSTLRERAGTWA